jgi:hypothetical protein
VTLTVTAPIVGSVTANAATPTTAGNITATANTTLTSLSSLATVGTITSGVWSGTAVAVEKGGTGAVTLTANNVLLGNGTSALQAVAPGTTGNILTSNGTTWISAAASNGGGTHTIGESYGGGKVFYVTSDGLHGLIAETQDQSTSSTWYNAQDIISTSSNHSTAGKLFTDWRLPSKNELNLLYLQKSVVGSFATLRYWSSTESVYLNAWSQYFIDGLQNSYDKATSLYVRAIRAF